MAPKTKQLMAHSHNVTLKSSKNLPYNLALSEIIGKESNINCKLLSSLLLKQLPLMYDSSCCEQEISTKQTRKVEL